MRAGGHLQLVQDARQYRTADFAAAPCASHRSFGRHRRHQRHRRQTVILVFVHKFAIDTILQLPHPSTAKRSSGIFAQCLAITRIEQLQETSLRYVFPEGFPFKEAAKETWSIFYFTPVSEMKTKITVVGLGYNDTEQSQKMRAFFGTANKYSMEQLRAKLEEDRNGKQE